MSLWRRWRVASLLLVVLPLVTTSCIQGQEDSSKAGRVGKHLSVGVYDLPSIREAMTSAVIRPFGRRLENGVDVWSFLVGIDSLRGALAGKQWDVLQVPADVFDAGWRNGLFACLTTCSLSGRTTLDEAERTYGRRAGYVGQTIAYRPSAFSNLPPQGWSDFWDLVRYPGRRALKDSPRGLLELALIADGVSPSGLYPLDVDRALRRLDRIRPYVAVWWSDETEVAAALRTGSVALADVPSTIAHGNLYIGSDVVVLDAATALEQRWWIIPNGKGMTPEAARFLGYATSTSLRTVLAKNGILSPISSISSATSTDGSGTPWSFTVSDVWWSTYGPDVNRRWRRWRSRHDTPASPGASSQ